jgi:hypothetical protein
MQVDDAITKTMLSAIKVYLGGVQLTRPAISGDRPRLCPGRMLGMTRSSEHGWARPPRSHKRRSTLVLTGTHLRKSCGIVEIAELDSRGTQQRMNLRSKRSADASVRLPRCKITVAVPTGHFSTSLSATQQCIPRREQVADNTPGNNQCVEDRRSD